MRLALFVSVAFLQSRSILLFECAKCDDVIRIPYIPTVVVHHNDKTFFRSAILSEMRILVFSQPSAMRLQQRDNAYGILTNVS